MHGTESHALSPAVFRTGWAVCGKGENRTKKREDAVTEDRLVEVGKEPRLTPERRGEKHTLACLISHGRDPESFRGPKKKRQRSALLASLSPARTCKLRRSRRTKGYRYPHLRCHGTLGHWNLDLGLGEGVVGSQRLGKAEGVERASTKTGPIIEAVAMHERLPDAHDAAPHTSCHRWPSWSNIESLQKQEVIGVARAVRSGGRTNHNHGAGGWAWVPPAVNPC
jgi:hypothetical protein